MINGNRAQSAPTHNGKVSEIFANTQMRTPKYRIGEIVRVKSDGAELPIENIVDDGHLYVVGGLYTELSATSKQRINRHDGHA